MAILSGLIVSILYYSFPLIAKLQRLHAYMHVDNDKTGSETQLLSQSNCSVAGYFIACVYSSQSVLNRRFLFY